MNKPFKYAAILTIAGLATSPAFAQGNSENIPVSNDLSGMIGLGIGTTPDFVGSEDYQAIPFFYGKVQKDNYWFQLQGLEASANLIDSERFNAGPVINYRFGRDDDVENDVISRLREVDVSVEVGLFASYAFPDVATRGDSITLKGQIQQDINDGHDGIVGELSAAYGRPITEQLYLTGTLSAGYGSDDYMESFFGVDANNSARSGLNQFEAEGGFQDVGINLTANYALTEQWGLFGMVGYSHLVGDAADSPIVSDQGDEGQGIAAIGVTYRF